MVFLNLKNLFKCFELKKEIILLKGFGLEDIKFRRDIYVEKLVVDVK